MKKCSSCLNRLGKSAPKLIEDLVPKLLPMSVVVKVLQYLLLERGAGTQPAHHLRDARGICTEDPGSGCLGGRRARRARPHHRAKHRRTARGIAGDYPGPCAPSRCCRTRWPATRRPGFEPGLADRIQTALGDSARRQDAAGEPAVLLVAPKIRPWIARLMRHSTPSLAVLAYNEIPENRRIRVIAAVGR